MTLIQIFLSGSSIGLNLGMSQGFYRRLKPKPMGGIKKKLLAKKLKKMSSFLRNCGARR